MPYSLIGASAIGFDLARLTGGERAAIVLRGALATSPSTLSQLAAAHPGHRARERWRRRRLEASSSGPTSSSLIDVLPLAGAALDAAAAGETALLRRLEQSMLGDADALERLIRHELLDWTWVREGSLAVQDQTTSDAADVWVDAALAAYLQDGLDVETRRAMVSPLLRSAVALPDDPATTGVRAADQRLDRLLSADEVDRDLWRVVVEQLRPRTGEWAPAMHQATWALSITERLHLAVDVQLAGVLAFRRGGFTAHDAAYGVWNALSGVLQATIAEDLLSEPDLEVLLRPWHLVESAG